MPHAGRICPGFLWGLGLRRPPRAPGPCSGLKAACRTDLSRFLLGRFGFWRLPRAPSPRRGPKPSPLSANNPRLRINSRGWAGRSCIRPAAGLRTHRRQPKGRPGAFWRRNEAKGTGGGPLGQPMRPQPRRCARPGPACPGEAGSKVHSEGRRGRDGRIWGRADNKLGGEEIRAKRFPAAGSNQLLPGRERSGAGAEGRRDGAAVRADGVGRDHFRYKRGTAVPGPRDFLPDHASGTGAGRAPAGRSCTGGQKLRAAASTSPPRLRTASGLYAIFGIKSGYRRRIIA